MNANVRLILMGLVTVAAVSGAVYLYSTTWPLEQHQRQCRTASGKAGIEACTWVVKSEMAGKDDLAAAYTQRGNRYGILKQYDRALADFDAALSLKPDAVEALAGRGWTYSVLGRHQRAVIDFDKVVSKRPNANTYNLRCWARATWGEQLDAALADCNESLKLKPDYADALDSRALVHYRRGEYGLAVGDASGALSIDLKLAPSLYVRGLARLHEGNETDGNADIAAAKKLDPKIAETYAGYGVKP
jgi:tetratricopeptide (TPR) repeat protein